MVFQRLKAARSLLLAAVAMAFSGTASGAGFAIIEHSAQGMGNAFAGGGAVAEDASTVWFNPASMVRLDSQIQSSGHIISPSFEFTDGGSVQAVGAATIPLLPTAPASNDGGKLAIVPNFYYVRKINPKWHFGLAVNAPFGLATKYDANWKGRYQAIESEIIDLNINPALAYRVSDKLSLGAGVSVNYVDAKLTNAIDFVAVCAGLTGGPGCTGFAGGAGLGQGANDGFVENKADDISFGFNLGIFYEPTNRTRLSMAYRSQINHKLDGTAKFQVPATVHAVPAVNAGILAAFADDGISIGASLPDSFSFGAYHRLNPKIGLMADFTWTNWATLPALVIVFDSPTTAGGPGVETVNWQNTWRFAFGANYYYDDKITLRTGVAYDESPANNATFRTARLPDNDRLWVSFGASYKIKDHLSADFGYAHLFIKDTPIARTGSTGNVLIGTFESSADILSVQVNYKFK